MPPKWLIKRLVLHNSRPDGAKQAADGARTFAEQGLTKLDQSMQAMNKFEVLKSDNILFDFNKDTLTDEGKAQLDDLAHQAAGLDRYVIELQGFTDKTGSPTYNENFERGSRTDRGPLSREPVSDSGAQHFDARCRVMPVRWRTIKRATGAR